MYKNLEMPIISAEKLAINQLLSFFSAGHEIVFVTEDGKLLGGITQGDFNRALQKNIEDASRIINTNIQHIIIHDILGAEEQARSKAAVIFNQNNRINNIPVVNECGILCYQYVRERNSLQKRIINILNLSNADMVLKPFFQCYRGLKIVITGADDKSLERTRNLFFNKYNQNVNDFENFEVSVKSLDECSMLGEKYLIIALTDFCITYLKNYTNCRATIMPFSLLPELEYYLRIYELTKEGILTWKQIFGYDEAIIIAENQYVDYIKSLMKQCGIKIKIPSASEMELLKKKKNFMNFLLISENGKYIEEVSVSRFVKIIQLLEDYKNVSGKNYSFENYLFAFAKCFAAMKKQGAEVVCFSEFNQLDVRTREELIKRNVKVIDDDAIGQEYAGKILLDCRNYRPDLDAFIIDFVYDCIQYSIDNEVYMKLKKICRNVYQINNRSIYDKNFLVYPEETRMNYLREGSDMFPDDFLEDIYGDKKFPVEELLKDISECYIDKITDGYMKYRSNYFSEYFNTDTYGNRVTTDEPSMYLGSIYLLGCCMMSGYAVSDYDTTASYLQRQINKNQLPYRVINLAIDNGANQYIYRKILERDIKSNDIIVMQFSWAVSEDYHTFSFDYQDMQKILAEKNKRYYWDCVNHCSSSGYKIIADHIFKHIKHDLVRVKKSSFRVNESLEKEIKIYLSTIKKEISGCRYNKDKMTSGAIVMNCNPFTNGHQYLIETASRLVNVLYVFVVEEDRSIFSFNERFKMVREGTKHFENVFVLTGGRFMISTVTFPGYFMKEKPTKECYDSFLDLKIFAHYIAPEFGISMRFVGEEPFDKVTAQYNRDMKIILGNTGISVLEIPRKKSNGQVVSATSVRQFLEDKNWEKIRSLVPESTYNILFGK